MTDKTNIEWADSTFNGWEGCTKVGPGCDNCYAENRNARFGGGESANWGPGAPRRRTSASNWQKPVKWNDKPFFQCGDCGYRGDDFIAVNDICPSCEESHPQCPKCSACQAVPARRRVFCASLADWLDNEAPVEWLIDLLMLIRMTPNLDWLLLTKRIGNFDSRMDEVMRLISQSQSGDTLTATKSLVVRQMVYDWRYRQPPANVWLGATMVNQTEVDRDMHKLLDTPAAIRFISVEPMLGLIDISPYLEAGDSDLADDPLAAALLSGAVADGHAWVRPALDWVICGGESGPGARPMKAGWALVLRDQCKAAGVPFLFKQWGEWLPDSQNPAISGPGGETQAIRVGKKAAGRKLDGATYTQWPVVSQCADEAPATTNGGW